MEDKKFRPRWNLTPEEIEEINKDPDALIPENIIQYATPLTVTNADTYNLNLRVLVATINIWGSQFVDVLKDALESADLSDTVKEFILKYLIGDKITLAKIIYALVNNQEFQNLLATVLPADEEFINNSIIAFGKSEQFDGLVYTKVVKTFENYPEIGTIIAKTIVDLIGQQKQLLEQLAGELEDTLSNSEKLIHNIAQQQELIDTVVQKAIKLLTEKLDEQFKELTLKTEFEELKPLFPKKTYDLNKLSNIKINSTKVKPFPLTQGKVWTKEMLIEVTGELETKDIIVWDLNGNGNGDYRVCINYDKNHDQWYIQDFESGTITQYLWTEILDTFNDGGVLSAFFLSWENIKAISKAFVEQTYPFNLTMLDIKLNKDFDSGLEIIEVALWPKELGEGEVNPYKGKASYYVSKNYEEDTVLEKDIQEVSSTIVNAILKVNEDSKPKTYIVSNLEDYDKNVWTPYWYSKVTFVLMKNYPDDEPVYSKLRTFVLPTTLENKEIHDCSAYSGSNIREGVYKGLTYINRILKNNGIITNFITKQTTSKDSTTTNVFDIVAGSTSSIELPNQKNVKSLYFKYGADTADVYFTQSNISLTLREGNDYQVVEDFYQKLLSDDKFWTIEPHLIYLRKKSESKPEEPEEKPIEPEQPKPIKALPLLKDSSNKSKLFTLLDDTTMVILQGREPTEELLQELLQELLPEDLMKNDYDTLLDFERILSTFLPAGDASITNPFITSIVPDDANNKDDFLLYIKDEKMKMEHFRQLWRLLLMKDFEGLLEFYNNLGYIYTPE